MGGGWEGLNRRRGLGWAGLVVFVLLSCAVYGRLINGLFTINGRLTINGLFMIVGDQIVGDQIDG